MNNKTRDQYVAEGADIWKPVLGSYYDFQKDCNSRPYDPDNPLFCITPSDRHLQDDRNGWIDIRSPAGWAKGEQEVVSLNSANEDIPWGGCRLGPGGPIIVGPRGGELSSGMSVTERRSEYLGKINGYYQLASKDRFNYHTLNYYVATKIRIEKICPGLFDSVWPEFYHPYNTPNGKSLVDSWLAAHPNTPQSCVDALKNNFTEYSETHFGLLNEPDPWNGYYPGLFQDNAGYSAWTRPVPGQTSLEREYLKKPSAFSSYNGHFFGNPLWSKTDRNQALSRALGKEVVSGQDFYQLWAQTYVNAGVLTAGSNALDYFDPEKSAGQTNVLGASDERFSGKLPYAPVYLVGNEPWHNSTQSDDNYGYDNPCNRLGLLEQYLPIFAGIVGGGFALLVFPGETSKFAAAATLGGTCYLLTKGVYGWQATLELFGAAPESENKNLAAKTISVGVPVTFALKIVELNVLPGSLQSFYGTLGVVGCSAALGYLLIYPVILPTFGFGGSSFTLLTAPIAALEHGLMILFSGCLNHLAVAGDGCKCEVANTKPKIIAAVTTQILGTTGAQNQLRRQCLRAAMTTGAWGTDPSAMGRCNLANGEMSDKAACYPAGSWVYANYSRGTPNSQQMFNEIQHCMDAENLSMLPPRPEDQGCVDAYGIYARNDGSGVCKDFRAPLGLQNVGQYVFDVPKSNECAIL